MSTIKKYIPEFIYGSVDGTVTTFAIVAASVGAGLSGGMILVLGVANLLADGFSMGASSFLAAQADESKSHVQKKPIPVGSATFVAFLVAGLAPLVVYIYDAIIGNAAEVNSELFPISVILTLCAFVGIGYIKARVEKSNMIFAILTTVGLGAIAAGLAYFAGDWLGQVLGLNA